MLGSLISIGTNQVRFLGLAFSIAFAMPAIATPTTTPLSCAGTFGAGGCAPYGQITYDVGGPSAVAVYEYDQSQLDYSALGSTAFIQGSVNLVSGELKTYAYGFNGSPGDFVIAKAADVFTLHSATSGNYSFSVGLAANGTGLITTAFSSGQVSIGFGGPTLAGAGYDIETYQAGTNVFKDIEFYPSLAASLTYTVTAGTPFELDYYLRADVKNGVTFDLLHTATLSFFDLADGMYITSMGGYDSRTFAEVPEPGSYSLLLVSLALMGVISRRNKQTTQSA